MNNIVKYFVRKNINKAIKEMENSSFDKALDIMNACLIKNFKNLSYIQDNHKVITFDRVDIPKSFNRTKQVFTDAFSVIYDKEVRFFFEEGNENIYDAFGREDYDILIQIMKNILMIVK